MRYIKYSKVIILGLFSLTLCFIQCKKETGFKPYPHITGHVIDEHGVPIDSAEVWLWIDGIGSDTLKYYTDSTGAYSTERINNWFDKSLYLSAFKLNPPHSDFPYRYVPSYSFVSPSILNTRTSVTSDTVCKDFELYDALNAFHIVIPKKIYFLDGEDRLSFMIINNGYKILYWEIGDNDTEWMDVYWVEVYNTTSDINHLKPRGYARFTVRIRRELLTSPGTYESSILVITDQGNTVIPVHVVVE